MDKKTKLVGSIVAGAVLLGAAFAGGVISTPTPEPVVVEKVVVSEKIVEVKVPGPVQYLPGEVKTVEVDNGKLDEVLQAIYDNDGDVAFVTTDLKDSEVADIADRFVLVNDFKAMALDEVKKNIADLVDKEVVANVTIDDKDVERIRLNDDANEIIVDDIDFDDKDATLLVTGTFEADDVKYEFEVAVDVKDGSVDDSSLESLDLA